jgi:ketosteroid isomerase-like protein
MPVIAQVIIRDVTKEQYDAVRDACGWLETAPDGGLAHLSWWQGNDNYNLDAWESPEAFQTFGETRLGPAMAQAGVDREPEVTFYDAHEVFLPRALTNAPTATGSLTNADRLAGAYAAFARQDMDAVMAAFDPQIRWYSPDSIPFGGTYTGREGVGEFFSKLPQNYVELNVTPERYTIDGDTVVVTGRHTGRTQAGTQFELPFVHRWTFRNGLAATFYEWFDTAKMNVALSGVPQQAGSVRGAPVSV